MTSEEIRNQFLAFFRKKEHEVVSSSSLVPEDDPTLLFTNAGMNQFKDVFLGQGSRPYLRAVDTQKCLRVSGKHNDLEEVGLDTYHHTFFEMLGNWSFGDYFKKEAIRWAWELLVDEWGLEPDRLYATVHEGDQKLGLQADEEARGFWGSETSIPADHILNGSSKDNFWMMGDTGPCGPCSEIHIDLRSDEERADVPGRDLVNMNDPRVMEIWNLVFIQYNALGDGRLEPLAAQHVDTGMGFERIVAVLQRKTSNYDTDLFGPILAALAQRSPREGLSGYDDIRIPGDADGSERERVRIAMRVIADHIRAITFAVADGVTPGNVGRGYVIRRILRRAVRFGYQALDLRKPFLHEMVGVLANGMSGTFPELERRRAYVERVIRAEEDSFLETLGTGIGFFERILPYIERLAAGTQDAGTIVQQLSDDRGTVDLLTKAYVDTDRETLLRDFSEHAEARRMPGEVAFLLHDTYGFPVDLTRLMAREVQLDVDMARYGELMTAQKERARSAATFTLDPAAAGDWRPVGPASEDSVFVGYDGTRVDDARVTAYREVAREDGPPLVELVLDRTPFYAESGGQVGDTGTLRFGDDELAVLNTVRSDGHIAHLVERLPADLEVPVQAAIEVGRRSHIKKNHTATHLLHAALREVLGGHVAQKGSLVAPDRLRFDFSHFERVTPDELRDVARRINEVVQKNVTRQEERDVPFDEALSRGATALFGEKYGDTVRVITFDPSYSVELCGGTHVDATGEIGVFQFLHEGSVAAGTRRVEAVTGPGALSYIRREIEELERVRGQFKTLQRPSDEEVANLVARYKSIEKELAQARLDAVAATVGKLIEEAESVDDIRVISGRVPAADMDSLRSLGQNLRDRMGTSAVGVLGSVDLDNEKVYLVAAVSDDLTDRLQAGQLIGRLARLVGGGGGGRPQLATAGGREPEKLDEAMGAVSGVVADMAG